MYHLTPHDVAPAYTFSHFEFEPQVFQSPTTPLVALVSDTKIQVWRMGIKDATLLWTGETASQVVWDQAGQRLAFVTAHDVRVVDAQTGSIRALLQNVLPAEVTGIEWSPDSAYLRVSTGQQSYIFDASSGARVPLPHEIRPVRWSNGFLEVYHAALGRTEWWTIKALRGVTVGDQIPSVVSADRRFGAETQTGVLRLWHLAE